MCVCGLLLFRQQYVVYVVCEFLTWRSEVDSATKWHVS